MKKSQNPENKYINFICSNPKCRNFVILEIKNENTTEDPVEIMKTITCKKCGQVGFEKTDKTKKQIDEENKAKMANDEKKNKVETNDVDKRQIKRTIDRLSDDLGEIKNDLTRSLEAGKITPEHFAGLFINLSFLVYKYYRKDANINLFVENIRDYAYSTSKNILSKHYKIGEVDRVLENLLEEYDEKSDLEFLTRAKKVSQECLFGKTGQEAEEILADISELDRNIEFQNDIKSSAEKRESRDLNRINNKEENEFMKELRKNNKFN